MEAVKWFGYVVAAIVLLSVVAGLGLLVIAITTVGGAVFCAVALVALIAAKLKSSIER